MARILLTGASSGIGEAAALELAAAHHVIATVRSDAAASMLHERAAILGLSLDVAQVDVTDFAAVTELVGRLEREGGIDVLIQNAGAGYVGTTEELSMEALRGCLELNFFAAAHAVQAVLPGMRQRHRGRIVVISSVGGAVGQPFNDAYCAAKFAIEGLLESLHPVAATVGVHVSVIEPGPVETAFVANVTGVEHLLSGPDAPYASAKSGYLARMGAPERMAGMQTSADVAAVISQVVHADAPHFRYQTSPWSQEFVATKLADLDGRSTTGMTARWLES